LIAELGFPPDFSTVDDFLLGWILGDLIGGDLILEEGTMLALNLAGDFIFTFEGLGIAIHPKDERTSSKKS
jgi:hypothetical protein